MYLYFFVTHEFCFVHYYYYLFLATLGNALTYVYPALMYYSVVKKQGLKGEGLGLAISITSAIFGIAIGLVGT